MSAFPSPRDRYWQCLGDCTVDCGACKGKGRPAASPEQPEQVCVPIGEDAHARVSPEAPPELLAALGRLADAARADFAASPTPAEAQQDDEPAWVEPFYRWAKTDKSPGSYSAAFAAGWSAARPSADTETLRARIEDMAGTYAFLGATLHNVPAAQTYAEVAVELRAALDGPEDAK